MQTPLVSIIVPVYNVQDRITRCVDSLRAQSWKELEILLINDGSTDNSLALCAEQQRLDPRVHLVDKPNTGVANTRNLGLQLARGKYLQFVDSDDYTAPDYTERLVRAAEKTGADVVIAPYRMVIPAEARQQAALLEKLQEGLGIAPAHLGDETREYNFLPPGVMDRRAFALHLMDRPSSFYYGVQWNKLYRRSLLAENGLCFDTEVKWNEDMLLNLEVMRRASVFCAIDTAGYYYVQNPRSICHTQINPASVVQNKTQMFSRFKALYEELGLYEQIRPQLYKFLVGVSESIYPSGVAHKAMQYLGGSSPAEMLRTIERAAADLEAGQRGEP